jgi:glucokinase
VTRSAVGIDVGGTHLRVAVVSVDGTASEVVREPSSVASGTALVASLLAALDALGEGANGHLPVGVGLAGLVDRSGRLLYGPNVGVRDTPVAALLADALGRPVRVVNDASAAVLAEHRAGAARGHDDVVMLTLGTGVGGGAVVAGRLLEGAHGMAGEFGHLVIAAGGRDAPSGVPGTLEAYASGPALERDAVEALAAGVPGAAALDAPGVVSAARDGAPWALRLIERIGHHVGIGAASLAAALDPAIVVIGGGAGQAMAPFLLDAARRSFRSHLMGADMRPPVPLVAAELGDDAGLIGAGLAVLELLEDA